MKVSVFGLGYVGCVSAACLADDGHEVVGVDIDITKVKMINIGRSPIMEKDLAELIKRNVSQGNLRATSKAKEAIRDTDISLVCVGTPSTKDGSISLDYLERCTHDIGEALREEQKFHIVVFRSTMLPGTIEGKLVPILENTSGKKVKYDFGVCMNPEFLREGTAVADFYNPSRTLIGEINSSTGQIVEALYKKVTAPVIRTQIKIAEMIKYAENAFHALKVVFANEIGALCKEMNIDGHEIMNVFCQDTKLNLSPYYLKPGFAFGGSCLSKDSKALTFKAKELDLDLPILSSIVLGNELHIKRIVNVIENFSRKEIGVIGLSFKHGTDDLRESPAVKLVETLIGKGYSVTIFDQEVRLASIIGTNKEYINKHIPHISDLMTFSIEDLINKSEIIVVTKKIKGIAAQLSGHLQDKMLLDLVKIPGIEGIKVGSYYGIAW